MTIEICPISLSKLLKNHNKCQKNISHSVKLLQYYKFINHNLIYNNIAINRYKKSHFEIAKDKADSLETLKKSIINLKIVI